MVSAPRPCLQAYAHEDCQGEKPHHSDQSPLGERRYRRWSGCSCRRRYRRWRWRGGIGWFRCGNQRRRWRGNRRRSWGRSGCWCRLHRNRPLHERMNQAEVLEVPASVKVRLKVWPFWRKPLFQIPFGLGEFPEVVVCELLPMCNHVTVSPIVTTVRVGEKKLSPIFTLLSAACTREVVAGICTNASRMAATSATVGPVRPVPRRHDCKSRWNFSQ